MRREHVVNSVLALSLAAGVVAALGWTSAEPGRSAATHTNDQPTAPGLDAAVENLWLAPSDSEAGGGRGAPPIWSGGRPVGDAAFDALAHAGVEVIISVDGAKTDMDRAEARGMRYVHVPIGYHGLSDEQQLLVAKALRDAEGPVYIHCHHGKHRGPAAAAAALVRLGQLTPENAETWMARVGTSPKYSGLYTSVREATPATDEAITASGELVAQSKVNDMASAMVELETRLDHLIACQTAGDASGWPAPPDHPDLVPIAEAARISSANSASAAPRSATRLRRGGHPSAPKPRPGTTGG